MSIIIITGPTASGKTAVAVRVAQILDGEVVSADSMQIYKNMDIGTAKPMAEEKQGIPHHMIDTIDPRQSYNAACYQKDAANVIQDILKRGKTAIICGGTGLYINSLIFPMSFGSTGTNEAYRAELNSIADTKGLYKLYDMLLHVDENAAARIHANDRKRIIRALELHNHSAQTQHEEQKPLYKTDLTVVLNTDRAELYSRINRRVDSMMNAGLVNEVKSLLTMGCSAEMQSMQAIGYKEICLALNGDMTKEKAVELIKQGSRNYAKRQITWFKRYYPDAVIHDAVKFGIEATSQSICAKLKEGNINK